MTTQLTFYLSHLIGKKLLNNDNKPLAIIKDFIIDNYIERPKVIGLKIKQNKSLLNIDFAEINISKEDGRINISCNELKEIHLNENNLLLAENLLDKQIVDIEGRKLVRVNDIRLVLIPAGAYVIAVDVGIEGLLRRLGVENPIQLIWKLFKTNLPSKHILWDDVQAVDFSKIKLSKPYSKLHTLHPSDLADIIEELDKKTSASIFATLDEEKAAEVLEELESHTQVHIIESMSKEKAADLLEMMPIDEAADIIEELEDEKAEELLLEMDNETSEDVRELLEYPEHSVGSIMTTDYYHFNENMTVNDTIKELRRLKPESDTIYSLLILDDSETLIATVSLRDLIISEPEQKLSSIMNKDFISVYDDDNMDTLAEIISKYDLLAIPVTDKNMKIEGMVIIDDIIEDLIDERKTI